MEKIPFTQSELETYASNKKAYLWFDENRDAQATYSELAKLSDFQINYIIVNPKRAIIKISIENIYIKIRDKFIKATIVNTPFI